jgi:hypothetical protein
MQPYHFTIMLVVVQVLIVFHVAHTSNHHLLVLQQHAGLFSTPRTLMVYTVPS